MASYLRHVKTRIPDANGELSCARCKLMLPVEKFSITVPYTDGTTRYKSYCKQCESIVRRASHYLKTSSRLWTEVAPKLAARRMVDENPEALEVLQRAFPQQWHRYVEEERKKLLDRRESHLQSRRVAARRNKGT